MLKTIELDVVICDLKELKEAVHVMLFFVGTKAIEYTAKCV